MSDFVDELYEEYGIRNFFLDEIHKYPNWNQELKNIYDSYPEIKIVFSGSSSIDLIKGAYDLSRRGVLVRMAGMSFREYRGSEHKPLVLRGARQVGKTSAVEIFAREFDRYIYLNLELKDF